MKNSRIDAFVKSLVFEADLGNFDPLCQFLMSDEPLTAEDRERLAWLSCVAFHKGQQTPTQAPRKLPSRARHT
ncbi:hypothetical protein [Tardiphaga sp.]|uniref:hypothetical protein n=1 Tax=Tardiphaga sp. TaxID=1926292 RepID=UPI0037D99322